LGRFGLRISEARKTKEASKNTVDLTYFFRRLASEEARSTAVGWFEKSNFGLRVREIPAFDINEIVLGKRLGKGGFSNVDEVLGIQPPRNPRGSLELNLPSKKSHAKLSRSDTIATDNNESRKFIAEHCCRRSRDARYAIKMLRRDIIDSKDKLILGLCDLAIETTSNQKILVLTA
jgi:hypothetical protein